MKIKGTIKHYYRPSRMLKNKAPNRPWLNLSRNSHTLLVKFDLVQPLRKSLIFSQS